MAQIAQMVSRPASALAVAGEKDPTPSPALVEAATIMLAGQMPDGSWMPDASDRPATVFDTALVLTALQERETDPQLARSTYRVEELRETIAKGRAYLEAQQRPDGSWPKTVRGGTAGRAAQRLSTTGWALMALLGGSK